MKTAVFNTKNPLKIKMDSELNPYSRRAVRNP